jgi:hypothetical protein
MLVDIGSVGRCAVIQADEEGGEVVDQVSRRCAEDRPEQLV